ncbi:FecR family protein [Marinoscillum furvescens]|uniref:FecR family protein n=1 Tax=Marinoscillum furvescens DSM 4134 TaxID=1122208 RepID=A0A3D9L145_MARFU|nr:FecR family protein [Marinoscillum furvescens]RED95298.1 FecR family protein [Marinoscillum furvescens DSM 4134]
MDRLTQIQDYFAGKLSRKEAEEFLAWYLSAHSEEEVQAEFDKLWHAKSKSAYQWDGSDLYQQILQTKNNERTLNVAREQSGNPVKTSSIWWKVAAAVALLVVAAVVLNLNQSAEQQQIVAQYEQVSKSNPAGQKSKVYLPDGTIVNLNSESSITYTEGFANGREVHLSGEAFFDVTEDPSRPFTVHSGGLATTALGTSFNINSYNKGQTEVVLVTGKVKVVKEGADQLVYLDPGEKATLSDRNDLNKSEANLTTATYWKEGILYFDRTDISEVVTTLERWYGVRIDAKNLPQVKCYGTFQKNEYLTNVLDVLSHSVGFGYEINGKEVKLDFKQK